MVQRIRFETVVTFLTKALDACYPSREWLYSTTGRARNINPDVYWRRCPDWEWAYFLLSRLGQEEYQNQPVLWGYKGRMLRACLSMAQMVMADPKVVAMVGPEVMTQWSLVEGWGLAYSEYAFTSMHGLADTANIVGQREEALQAHSQRAGYYACRVLARLNHMCWGAQTPCSFLVAFSGYLCKGLGMKEREASDVICAALRTQFPTLAPIIPYLEDWATRNM